MKSLEEHRADIRRLYPASSPASYEQLVESLARMKASEVVYSLENELIAAVCDSNYQRARMFLDRLEGKDDVVEKPKESLPIQNDNF